MTASILGEQQSLTATPPKRIPELWFSIDVEASGTSPSVGSLLSIGACLVTNPGVTFYVEIQPEPTKPWDPEAEAVHGLTKEYLAANGHTPKEAMESFFAWVKGLKMGYTYRPVFVGWNASFDWMFTDYAFHKFVSNEFFAPYKAKDKWVRKNPFGIAGLDLKAAYLGKHWQDGVREWRATAKSEVTQRYALLDYAHSHNALEDAQEQAELCRQIFDIPKVQPLL